MNHLCYYMFQGNYNSQYIECLGRHILILLLKCLPYYYRRTGGMAFGKKGGKELSSVLKAIKSCDIPHKLMSASEANRVVPQLNIPDEYECVLEEDGGIIHARSAVEVLQVCSNIIVTRARECCILETLPWSRFMHATNNNFSVEEQCRVCTKY